MSLSNFTFMSSSIISKIMSIKGESTDTSVQIQRQVNVHTMFTCITDTYTQTCRQMRTGACYYTADRQEHKLTYAPSLFSVVEHVPHIKNKFIQSQFGECLAMQGRNTI